MSESILINWGSYDVDNFGDLLFPFIVEFYLKEMYSKIIHVSPTGTKSRWSDALPTCTIKEALKNENIKGILIGGGNLISFTKSTSINYVQNETLAKIVHPSFFYVPYLAKLKYNIPFAFNYVGVSKPILPDKIDAVKKVMDAASLISCRDIESTKRLQRCNVQSDIITGLDSAIDISKVFPLNSLQEYFTTNSLCRRYNIPKSKYYAVIHLKEKYLENQLEEVISLIEYLGENSIQPILIPLGMCHEDEQILQNQCFLKTNATIINNPLYLFDILSIIAISDFYLGSSLHGAIASLAYGNKISIVANEKKNYFSKFSGFLSQINLQECLFDNWANLVKEIKLRDISVLKKIPKDVMDKANNQGDIWRYFPNIFEESDNVTSAKSFSQLEQSIENFFF